MRRLLTLAFLLAVSFLAVNLLGAIGFFLSAVACALFYAALLPAKLPEQLAVEDMQLVITRRFALSVSGFLLLVFVFFHVISSIIGLEEVRLQPLPFLLDTLWLRLFWSTALAFLGAIVVFATILLPLAYLNSRAMYGDYEQYKGHEWGALHSAISIALGINKCTWSVREGKAEVLYPPVGGLARLGGPGVLFVQEGHAVVLEKSGAISSVAGPGLTWLQPFERVSMVVDLQLKTIPVEIRNVVTKDHITLEKFAFWIFAKVDPGENSVNTDGEGTGQVNQKEQQAATEGQQVGLGEKHTDISGIEEGKAAKKDDSDKKDKKSWVSSLLDQMHSWASRKRGPLKGEQTLLYPYNESNIKDKIWSAKGADPMSGVKSVGETAARDVIGRCNMEDLFPLSDTQRQGFKTALTEQINKVAQKLMGVKVIAVDIGEVEPPENVAKTLLERQLVKWEEDIVKTRAAIDKIAMMAKGEGEAEAVKQVEGAKLGAIHKMVDEMERIISVDRSKVDATTLKQFIDSFRAICTSIVSGDITAMRYIDALESLAKSEGPKSIYLGEQSLLMGMNPQRAPEEK